MSARSISSKLTGKPDKSYKETAPQQQTGTGSCRTPKPEPVAEAPAPVSPEPAARRKLRVTRCRHEPKETEIYRPGYEKLAGPKIVDKIDLVPEVKKSRDQAS
ncbi:MAG: hypothetical protein MZV63_42815 [Marinilabiliales bacterium]|nr:hypothetical protein [Marinilabiliales bacterium]